MTKEELIEIAAAMKGFLDYVEEYSDPVVDEDRFVRFRRAQRKLKKRIKEMGQQAEG